MCEYFINKFVEKTLNKLTIYRVKLDDKPYHKEYYFRGSSQKEIIKKIKGEVYDYIIEIMDNNLFFNFNEKTKEIKK